MSEQNNEILLILLGGSPEEGKDTLFQPPVPPTALVQTRAAEIGLAVLPGDLITGWGWETLSSFLWGRLFQKLKLAAEIRRSRFVLQLPEALAGWGWGECALIRKGAQVYVSAPDCLTEPLGWFCQERVLPDLSDTPD